MGYLHSVGSDIQSWLALVLVVLLPELSKSHVATAHSHNQLVVHDLSVDLLGSEDVEARLVLSNWDIDLELVDVSGEQLVHLVSLVSLVQLFLGLLGSISIGEHGSPLTESLLKPFDDDVLVSEHVLQGLKVVLLLLQDDLEFLALLLDLLDLLLQVLVGLLPHHQDILQVLDFDCFLLHLEDVDVNLVFQVDDLLLVLDDLRVPVDKEESFGVHLFEQSSLFV